MINFYREILEVCCKKDVISKNTNNDLFIELNNNLENYNIFFKKLDLEIIKSKSEDFNRFYYFHFNDNGIWSKSGGFYSKQEMLSDFKTKNADIDNNLYEISIDTLFLESYNSYRKKLEYSKAIVKKDTIFVSDIKNKVSNTPYVFYSIEN